MNDRLINMEDNIDISNLRMYGSFYDVSSFCSCNQEKVYDDDPDSIKDAKNFLNSLGVSKDQKGYTFSSYGPFYTFTTEDIKGTMIEHSPNDRILTVLSSGDHLLNYIASGVIPENIETFDINIVTKYFWGLKKAWIIKLSLNDFLEFSSNNFVSMLLSLDSFSNFMDKNVYDFWRYFLDHSSLYHLYGSSCKLPLKTVKNHNLFLESKNYDKVRYSLKNSLDPKFYNCDVKNISKMLHGTTYDEVNLSNILDYSSNQNEDIASLVSSLNSNISDEGRIVFYSYFGHSKMYSKSSVPFFINIHGNKDRDYIYKKIFKKTN